MKYSADVATFIGFVLIVAGIATWSRPAACIVAGVIILYVVRASAASQEESRD